MLNLFKYQHNELMNLKYDVKTTVTVKFQHKNTYFLLISKRVLSATLKS